METTILIEKEAVGNILPQKYPIEMVDRLCT